jgi:hypothetical protein
MVPRTLLREYKAYKAGTAGRPHCVRLNNLGDVHWETSCEESFEMVAVVQGSLQPDGNARKCLILDAAHGAIERGSLAEAKGVL